MTLGGRVVLDPYRPLVGPAPIDAVCKTCTAPIGWLCWDMRGDRGRRQIARPHSDRRGPE